MDIMRGEGISFSLCRINKKCIKHIIKILKYSGFVGMCSKSQECADGLLKKTKQNKNYGWSQTCMYPCVNVCACACVCMCVYVLDISFLRTAHPATSFSLYSTFSFSDYCYVQIHFLNPIWKNQLKSLTFSTFLHDITSFDTSGGQLFLNGINLRFEHEWEMLMEVRDMKAHDVH